MQSKSYKIVRIESDNIKRLKAVAIEPSGSVVEITGKNGAGKQQPVTEPVLTPIGWVPIGSITVGDYVIGSSGRPTKVTGVFPQEEKTTFKITMGDGAWTRCGPDHLWTVHFWRSGDGRSNLVTETMTTAEIINRGLRDGRSKRFSVMPVSPVEFADRGMELPINPYTLGVILGDGHIQDTGYTTITSFDDEVLDAVDCGGWRSKNEFATAAWSRPLRHLGLAGKKANEKFVPEIYFLGTVEERMALIAGLMDTDGTVSKSWAHFSTTSERLADGLVQLGLSVGYICRKTGPLKKRYRYNGEMKLGLPSWNVIVRSPAAPFRLTRKLTRWTPSVQQPEPRRFIDTIERVKDEDSVCIKVEAENGLYVTRGFILTHNTSLIDSIFWTLSGTSEIQSSPIRRGEEKARIKLDLGSLTITRRFNAQDDGSYTTSLVVESEEGARFQSPQKILDALVGSLAMDPLEFTRKKPREQFDALRQFVPGVDFDQFAADAERDFKARTEVNRRAKEARAQIAGIVVPDGTPDEPIDESALVQDMQAAGEHNANVEKRRANRETVRRQIESRRALNDSRNGRIAKIEAQIETLYEEMAALRKAIAEDEVANGADEKRLTDAGPLPEPIDTAAIGAKITEARRVNTDVARKARKAELLQTAEAHEKVSSDLTKAMADREEAKRDAIASAKMPVDGIGFGDDMITLNGLPFDQASSAEQLRASMALAMAANPKLRIVLVREGSLLDDDSMQIVREMAEKHDIQVWLETVASNRPGAVVIEDGMVRDAAPAMEAAE